MSPSVPLVLFALLKFYDCQVIEVVVVVAARYVSSCWVRSRKSARALPLTSETGKRKDLSCLPPLSPPAETEQGRARQGDANGEEMQTPPPHSLLPPHSLQPPALTALHGEL